MLAVVPPGSVAALTGALRAALDGSGPAVLPSDDPERFDPDGPVAPGIAAVVPTSGSTGDPKGVELSASALVASAEATHARLGGPGKWLLALPARHIAGIQVLVRSILAGFDPMVLEPGADFRAAGARYTALVPTQLVRLLGGAVDALRSFDAVLLGGAAAPEGLLRRAREAGIRVVTTYGMTETAGGCVYDGVPLDGVGVRIRDGLVELSGPTLARGYRNRPHETERAFAGGWFRTGDHGRLRDGVLEVLGRADDVINTGGVKVAAGAVERVLAVCPGVVEACVVGVPDPEWGQRVVAAVVGSAAADELRAAVRAGLGAAAVPKEIRFVDRLPVRGPGKVDRAAVADLF